MPLYVAYGIGQCCVPSDEIGGVAAVGGEWYDDGVVDFEGAVEVGVHGAAAALMASCYRSSRVPRMIIELENLGYGRKLLLEG